MVEIEVVVDDVHCPKCNHVFPVETTIDLEPPEYNDLD